MPYPLGLGYLPGWKNCSDDVGRGSLLPHSQRDWLLPKRASACTALITIKLPSSSSSFLLLLALRSLFLYIGCVAPSSRPFLITCIYKYIEILRFVGGNRPALPLSISLAEPDTNCQFMLVDKPLDSIYALGSTSPIVEWASCSTSIPFSAVAVSDTYISTYWKQPCPGDNPVTHTWVQDILTNVVNPGPAALRPHSPILWVMICIESLLSHHM